MIIYTIGCSNTIGHCVKFTKTWPNIIMHSIIGNNYDINPSEFHSKNILFNEANFGVGNDYIFHTSIEKISKLIDNDKKPDYVFVQWSGPNRRMYLTADGHPLYINPWDNVEYGVLFEPQASLNSLHYIYALQEFLKLNKIKYFFFNYIKFDKSILETNIYNKIDFTKFIEFGNKADLFSNCLDYFKMKDFTCDEQGHPSKEGNFEIAEKILNKLNISIIDKEYFYKIKKDYNWDKFI